MWSSSQILVKIGRFFSTSDVLVTDEILVMIELVEDLFEVDGDEKEGEWWWALMLGFFVEDPIDFFLDFLELLVLSELQCPPPGQLTTHWSPHHHNRHPPTARCAARLCVGTVLIVGHFYLFCIMPATIWGWCSSLHIKIMRSFWSKNEKWSKNGIKRGTRGKRRNDASKCIFVVFTLQIFGVRKKWLLFFSQWNE